MPLKLKSLALCALIGGVLTLGGCSGRDTELAEKLAAAEAAATRAEAAASRAEKAAKAAGAPAPVVMEAEPDPHEIADGEVISDEASVSESNPIAAAGQPVG